MLLKEWMRSLPVGGLRRAAMAHKLRYADFYDAIAPRPKRGERDKRVKTLARAEKISAATGGAVSPMEILRGRAE